VGFCGQFSEFEIIVPTVLNFKLEAEQETSMYEGALRCETIFRKKADGAYERGLDIAYCGGSWHLVLPEF
jgi:hypothetical protein